MKAHTVQGARLFSEDIAAQITSGDFLDLDPWCAEVTLDHHEKWDGTGYPGRLDDIFREPCSVGPGKKGEEISLTGRIVALADVYDALISKRVYKDAWTENEVLSYIRDQAGKQFDPEIVVSFFEIYEVIQSIREKFSEHVA
jgi:HD-GYP domain-containing protein (c-di-GMP phosphodiesterase class II)